MRGYKNFIKGSALGATMLAQAVVRGTVGPGSLFDLVSRDERQAARQLKRVKKQYAYFIKEHDNKRANARNLKLMAKIGGQFPEFASLEARNIATGKWA